MCLLAIHHATLSEAPVLVAANREERLDRPASPPALHEGSTRVLCGLDNAAGGTWLGCNEHGLLVAVTNRPKDPLPPAPRSRGLLCRDLLACRDAEDAARAAFVELGSGRYAGANFLCADPLRCLVVHGGNRHEILDVGPGLHLMTNGDLDDPQDGRQALARTLYGPTAPASAAEFVSASRRVCADAGIVVRGQGRGTVSSQIVALCRDPAQAVFLHADGPPDRQGYEDFSEALRALLGGRAAARAR
jgi:hypothetical protein